MGGEREKERTLGAPTSNPASWQSGKAVCRADRAQAAKIQAERFGVERLYGLGLLVEGLGFRGLGFQGFSV